MLRLGNRGLIQPPMEIDMFIISNMLNRFKDIINILCGSAYCRNCTIILVMFFLHIICRGRLDWVKKYS